VTNYEDEQEIKRLGAEIVRLEAAREQDAFARDVLRQEIARHRAEVERLTKENAEIRQQLINELGKNALTPTGIERLESAERQLAEAAEHVCRLLGQRESERADLLRVMRQDTPEEILAARQWWHDNCSAERRAALGEGGDT